MKLNLPPALLASLRDDLADRGYARLESSQTIAALNVEADIWEQLAESWNDLGTDLYMADGGRYRRRRHAIFHCKDGTFTRQPHQPHFQSRDYNPLNGDVQRWFNPVIDAIANNRAMQAIFALCATVFTRNIGHWHVEMHQFRIETGKEETGRPTPEGLHRDGVDRVFVMLVERRNVTEGVTRIGAPDGAALGEFTLTAPGDAVLIDDHRILHGVTEIHAIDPERPAWRDALVVTFRAQ